MVVAAAAMTACKPNGFVPVDPLDGGVDPTVLTAEDIGTPCIYNPAQPDLSPTNQCRGGLECAIVTRDVKEAIFNNENPTTGFNTMELTLPLYEDHLTVHNDDGTDTGYCTLIGTINVPPQCPVGTLAKGFSSQTQGGLAVACLKPCVVSADCDNGGVCDARYFDDGSSGETGFCVRPCENDFPDCLRTAIVNVDPADTSTFVTQIANIDLQGGRTCNEVSGVCEDTGVRAIGNDGDACDDNGDCAKNALCIQENAAGERLDKGFCARRCYVGDGNGPDGRNGGCGTELCQRGLGYGMDPLAIYDPNDFLGALPKAGGIETTDTRIADGFCFDICVGGAGCGARTDVICAAVDDVKIGAAWNGSTMCVPPGIAFEN